MPDWNTELRLLLIHQYCGFTKVNTDKIHKQNKLTKKKNGIGQHDFVLFS